MPEGMNPLEHQLSLSALISQSSTALIYYGGKMKYFQLCKCKSSEESTIHFVRKTSLPSVRTERKLRSKGKTPQIFIANNYSVKMLLIKITLVWQTSHENHKVLSDLVLALQSDLSLITFISLAFITKDVADNNRVNAKKKRTQ